MTDSVGVGGRGCSRAEDQVNDITKKSQLWVFPACPKILGCVADNFSARGAATIRLEATISATFKSGVIFANSQVTSTAGDLFTSAGQPKGVVRGTPYFLRQYRFTYNTDARRLQTPSSKHAYNPWSPSFPHTPHSTHPWNNNLVRTTHGQFHEVLHECLQRHIVGEDCLCTLGADAAVRTSARRMRGRRVELGEEETRLGTAVVADDETREREAVGDKILETLVSNGFLGIGKSHNKNLPLRPPLAAPRERQNSRSPPGLDTRPFSTRRRFRRGR